MSDNFELDDKKSKVYEKRSQRYQNTKDSAVALLVVGGAGAFVLVLSYFKILPFAISTLSFAAATVLCTFFLVFGVLSFLKSRRLKTEAEEEEAFTTALCGWLKQHVDASIVEAEKDSSEADIYFLRCQRAKELLLEEFPNTDEDYIDMILDENYDTLFMEK